MDEGWRRAERAWRANEDDPQAVELALAAARRARQPVPLGLWDRRRSPARALTSTRKFVVLVEREGEEDQEVGSTPGTVRVPECRAFWVRPKPARATAQVVEEVQREEATCLSLERSHVDDEGMALLAPLGERLLGLSLRTCLKLDPTALKRLERFPCLEELNLSGAKGINGDVLARVRDLTNLVQLSLARSTDLRDADLHALAGHPTLSRLLLDHTKLGDSKTGEAALASLATLPRLEELDLASCRKLRDAAVARLVREAPRLRRLNLMYCERVGDETAAAIGASATLRDLDLHRCEALTTAGIAALARAPLERLGLAGRMTDEVAKALAPLARSLCWLDASQSAELGRFGAAGVVALADLSRLEHLDLSRDGLRGADLAPLARLARLRSLRLIGVPLDDATSLPPQLESLTIHGRAVDALAKSAAPPALKRLEVLWEAGLSPGGRAALEALRARGCEVVVSQS